MQEEHYDLILVGSGFASMFFLYRYLELAPLSAKVLVLERGTKSGNDSIIQTGSEGGSFIAKNQDKKWFFTLGVGGSSSCWWACTPRFRPNDFRMQQSYGVGVDWPIDYNDLEPYYTEAEQIMSVSGPDYKGFFERSRDYPLPPHRFSSIDELIKKRYPEHFFQQPTARASLAVSTRPQCCASGVCHRCPISAKFTIVNDLGHLFRDERVTFRKGCNVKEIIHSQHFASGVKYDLENSVGHKLATADIIALGANGIFNPFLLEKSGLSHEKLGRGINDQISNYYNVDINGIEGFDGSTSVTGHGYMLYDGEHRQARAAALMETSNVLANFRLEKSKYLQRLNLKFIFEDLPQDRNRVVPNKENPEIPEIQYFGYSEYTQKSIDYVEKNLPDLLSSLPVEKIIPRGDQNKTEAHIQSTTPMGIDPKNSIVNKNQIHHSVQNLIVLGSSVFPTAPPANPTLTLSALSLRACDELMRK